MHQPRAKPQNGHWTVPMKGAVNVTRYQIRTTWKRRYLRNSRNQNRISYWISYSGVKCYDSQHQLLLLVMVRFILI